MAWDPDKHPRGPDGRFITRGALSNWAKPGKAKAAKKGAQAESPKSLGSTTKPTAADLRKWAASSKSSKAPLAHHAISKIESRLPKAAARKILQGLDALHADASAFLGRNPLKQLIIHDKKIYASEVAERGSHGLFNAGLSRVQINGARQDTPNSFGKTLKPGETHSISSVAKTPEEAAQRTLLHEVAHHLHLGPARKLIDPIVDKAFKQANPISKYGATTKNEYWTETFSAYHYHNAELKKHDPVGYKMVKRALKVLRTA